MDPAEAKRLPSLLDELRDAVEELVLAGLTAASKSTVERLERHLQGGVADEVAAPRLDPPHRQRGDFPLHFRVPAVLRPPAGVLPRSGVAAGDRHAPRRTPPATTPRWTSCSTRRPPNRSRALKVVALGVAKRVVPGAFASFDFRLRRSKPRRPSERGRRWSGRSSSRCARTWTCRPRRSCTCRRSRSSGRRCCWKRRSIEVAPCAVARQPTGPTRVMLGEASQVTAGPAFDGWTPLFKWNAIAAADRLAAPADAARPGDRASGGSLPRTLGRRREAADGRRLRPATDRQRQPPARRPAGPRPLRRAGAVAGGKARRRENGTARRCSASPTTSRAGSSSSRSPPSARTGRST